jgi:hypothetical protein
VDHVAIAAAAPVPHAQEKADAEAEAAAVAEAKTAADAAFAAAAQAARAALPPPPRACSPRRLLYRNMTVKDAALSPTRPPPRNSNMRSTNNENPQSPDTGSTEG